VRRLPVTQVPVHAILLGDSPRRGGQDRQHVQALADCEDPLPPIIVNRTTMRVIDGMHRLSAAKLRGHGSIDVRFVHCDEMSSFVLAVRANVTHGLPLSLTDRKAAAARILGHYPHWSDRAIAQVSGLSANTVAKLRHSLTEPYEQLDARIGRDGRVRPLDGAQRRAAAARLMREEPGASLRDVARRVGISPETARRVRAQLSLGTIGLSSPSEEVRLVTRRRLEPYGVISQQDDLHRQQIVFGVRALGGTSPPVGQDGGFCEAG
jgi:ParB-like chromosome segregation protein Spo0J